MGTSGGLEHRGRGVNVLPLRTPKAHCSLALCAVLPSTTSTLPEALLQYTTESASAPCDWLV